MKYLIANADDYGYRPDISQAIIEAHLKGILTSTTVLINFVSREDVQLAQNTPSLQFGLHLNLTSGDPITHQWQQKYGSFTRPFRNQPQQFNQEVWLPAFEKYQTKDVDVEYEAQYQKFIELFGSKPSHLDTHHYTSSYPTIFPAYIRLAQKHRLPVRLPTIWDIAINQHPMGNIIEVPKLKRKIKEMNIKTTDYFSLKYMNRYDQFLPVIEEELQKIKENQTIEISFHPGFDEEWRQKDLNILTNPQAKQLLQRLHIKLISYKDIV